MKNSADVEKGSLFIIGWAWAVIAAVMVLFALHYSKPFAATLLAISAVGALPSFGAAFGRYGVTDELRRVMVWGGALLGLLALTIPTAKVERSDVVEPTNVTEQSGNEVGNAASEVAQSPSNLGLVQGCLAIDGDTLRCSAEYVRLLGIDAPELPGHCQTGRECAPGDPYMSTNALLAAMRDPMQIERVGTDRYGRTLAMVYAQGRSLSCLQLQANAAIYKADWDDGSRVRNECSELASQSPPLGQTFTPQYPPPG